MTLSKWRHRLHHQDIKGPQGQQRPGCPRTHDEQRVAQVLNTTLQGPPPTATHGSVPALARHTGIAKSTGNRWFQSLNLPPHRHRYSKISNDPRFVDKVQDIVGLYLRPPGHAVVLCGDEKAQSQALERTQARLPLGLGSVEGVTHDSIRNGTTTLFAALDVATGKMLAQCKQRRRRQEFLSFLQPIDGSVPGIITQKVMRHGSLPSVGERTRKINDFVEHYNTQACSFVWVGTAESILAKIQRLCKSISRTLYQVLWTKRV